MIIANGHHRDPVGPALPGEDGFAGVVIHSSQYRDGAQLDDKRVLIIGIGQFGLRYCGRFRLPCPLYRLERTHTGKYFVPKFVGGAPHDATKKSKAGRIAGLLPASLRTWLKMRVLRLIIGKPEQYGLPKPAHRIDERPPVVNSNVLYHIGHGDVPRGARRWKDWTGRMPSIRTGRAAPADLVILATGYKVSAPFLDEDVLAWEGGSPRLRLSIFPHDYNGLIFAGLIGLSGGAWRVRDVQARLIARYLAAKLDDPARVSWFEAMDPEANPAATPRSDRPAGNLCRCEALHALCERAHRALLGGCPLGDPHGIGHDGEGGRHGRHAWPGRAVGKIDALCQREIRAHNPVACPEGLRRTIV